MTGLKLQRWLLPITFASLLAIAFGAILSSGPGRQMRIVRQIRAAGGTVGISPPNPAGWIGKMQSYAPDAFGDVNSVNLADIPVRKQWLYAIRDWKQLNELWLNRTGVTDADLEVLADHPYLMELFLNGNAISDQGLKKLGPQPYLQRLELDWTRVSKLDGIDTQFVKLHSLKLRGTPINNQSLDNLAKHSRLVEVDLSRTAITDQGLGRLEQGSGARSKGRRFSLNLSGSRTSMIAARDLAGRNGWYVQASNNAAFVGDRTYLLQPARRR